MDSDSYSWILGTLLIGVFLNTFLFGINSYQFGGYYHSKSNDPLWIRAFVGTLLIVDLFHTCLILYVAWFYCIENYTAPENLVYPLWAYCLTPIAEIIPALIGQIFLAVRVFKHFKNSILYAGSMFFALLTFAFGLATGVKTLQVTSLVDILKLSNVCVPWLVFQAFTNIALSAILSWGNLKPQASSKQAEFNVRRVLPIGLETGVLATIFSILSLASYVQFGAASSHLYIAFSLPLGRLYTLAVMYSLNARWVVKEEPEEIEIPSVTRRGDDLPPKKRASILSTSGAGLPIVRVTTPSAFVNGDGAENSHGSKRASAASLGYASSSSSRPVNDSVV